MGKHSCTTVGYGYSLNFIYGYVERAEEVSGYQQAGKLMWEGCIRRSGDGFVASTGRRGEKYKSSFSGKSLVQIYLGDNDAIPNALSGMCYKNIACAHFRLADFSAPVDNAECNYIARENIPTGGEGAFVGDSTTAVPEYKLRVSRYTLFHDLPNNQINKGTNPAYIILDILMRHLQVSKSFIDIDTFVYAAQILANEQCGMAFLMTRSKSALDWIKEVLRYIDGVFYYDIYDGKYKLRLFRKDYDPDNIPQIDDSLASSMIVEQNTWASCSSTLVFKYTDAWSGVATTFTVTNQAAIQMNGLETTKEFNFLALESNKALQPIVARQMAKNAIPLSTVKLRLNFVAALSFRPGDVFVLHSDKLQIPPKIYRVLKMGADREDNPYIDIQAMEDIYSRELEVPISPVDPNPPHTNYDLPNPPERYHIFQMPPEFVGTDLNYKPYFTALAPNSKEEVVTHVSQYTEENGGYNIDANPYRVGHIKYASKDNFKNLSEVGYHRDFKVILDNTEGYFTNDIILSDEEFQQGKLTIATKQDGTPLIVARNLILINGGEQAEVTGIACLNTQDIEFYDGPVDQMYVVSWSGASGNDYDTFVRYSRFPSYQEVISFTDKSGYCYNTSDPKHVLKLSMGNPYVESPRIDEELEGCFDYIIPYPASNIHWEYNSSSDEYTIKWRPLVSFIGATWQSADDYTLTDQEGATYGQFAIERSSNGSSYDVYDNIANPSCNSEGYITITIPSSEVSSYSHWAITAWTSAKGGSISDGTYIDWGVRRTFTIN